MFTGDRFRDLNALLHQRRLATTPEARAEVERRLLARFGARRAIVVTDMSGFSRITRQRGIVHFLSLIHHMQGLCQPIVQSAGGVVVKAVADNLFALFPGPIEAARTARALHAVCAEDASGRPPDERVELSIGIGYGDILDIDQSDCFGDEVNLAFKLGEDVASGGETLITAAAAAELDGGWALEPRRTRISGLDLDYFSLH